MLLDLALGLHDEAQADGIAGTPGQQADAEGAGVPERIEQAGTGVEFLQALARPGEVIGLLAGGLLELSRAAPGWRVASAWAL